LAGYRQYLPSAIQQHYGSQVVNERHSLDILLHPHPGNPPVEWLIAPGLTPYEQALAFMDKRVAQIAAGNAPELVWLVEHPPILTAGTSAKTSDLLETEFPVFQTGRGGQYTYHGPGQRVAYVMLDLKRRKQDLRVFVAALEAWIISTLASFNIKGEQREDRVGVWVKRPDKLPDAEDKPGAEDKIAAIGIRVRHWVTFHGISINVEPNLSHFNSIIPCGVKEPIYGVTSLVDLGLPVTMYDLDAVLKQEFKSIFGAISNS
jgi:lipoyl(octanoyl) transferase